MNTAKEIAEHVMLSGLATPHDLKVKFNLGLKEADKIYRLSAYAFGPGGKGFNWYVKKVEKILKSKTMNVAVARELVKVAKLLMSNERTATKEVTILVSAGLPRGMIGDVDSVGYNGREFWWRSKSGLKNSYTDQSRFVYSLSQEMLSSSKASQLARDLKHRFDAADSL